MKRSTRHIWKLLPISIIGVVAGHSSVYRLLFPDVWHRHAELQSSGHGYYPFVLAVAGLLCILSMAFYGWLGYQEKKCRPQLRTLSFGHSVATLFIIQTTLFIFMELLERLVAEGGHGLGELLTSAVIPLGLIFQLLTATLLVLSISTAYKIGSFLVSQSVHHGQPLERGLTTEKVYLYGFCGYNFSIRSPPFCPGAR